MDLLISCRDYNRHFHTKRALAISPQKEMLMMLRTAYGRDAFCATDLTVAWRLCCTPNPLLCLLQLKRSWLSGRLHHSDRRLLTSSHPSPTRVQHHLDFLSRCRVKYDRTLTWQLYTFRDAGPKCLVQGSSVCMYVLASTGAERSEATKHPHWWISSCACLTLYGHVIVIQFCIIDGEVFDAICLTSVY